MPDSLYPSPPKRNWEVVFWVSDPYSAEYDRYESVVVQAVDKDAAVRAALVLVPSTSLVQAVVCAR